MGSFASSLVLVKPSHTSVVELADPLGKDSSPVGARYVEGGGSSGVRLIPLWAARIGDLVVLNALFQHLDLPSKSNCLLGVGLLGLTDGANSPAQYPSEGGGIKGQYIL